MLKLSHTTKNTALAALLVAGLAGSGAVTLTPVAGHAQSDRDYYRGSDDRYRGDWDDRYRRDWDGHYRSDWYRYHRPYADDRGWVGVGVPGFGIGFYDYPAYSGYYGPYCSSYDYDNGYCSY
ncbi:MAG TPA: hypothetical protein VHY79_09205 [Rhizomicrobium sp.]|jgi:hypothetical protein|nr:hypothetical protein [Rhizomicrobium sp.]